MSPELIDVVVVGARCAGAATALLLARAGHDVVLLDRDAFPSDTLSTHAIARDGVVQLHRWGLLDDVLAAGTPPIRQVEIHVGGSSVARSVKDRSGVDLLVAPRRQVLDTLLVEAAERAGARLITGVTVDGVVRDAGGRVTGVRGRGPDGDVRFGARFVVGADGLRSRIARSVEAACTDRRASAGATHYAYFSGTWPAMEYYVGDRRFGGIFPTNDGEACIWVCAPAGEAERIRRSHPSVEAALDAMIEEAAPDLAHRLRATATRTSRARGVIGLPNYVRRPVGPGWALVGDAGYHRDPITGRGISDAFRDAAQLAGALDRVLSGDVAAADAMAAYHAERDHHLREIFALTCELLTYPPVDRFIGLLKALDAAIEVRAAEVAPRARPNQPSAA